MTGSSSNTHCFGEGAPRATSRPSWLHWSICVVLIIIAVVAMVVSLLTQPFILERYLLVGKNLGGAAVWWAAQLISVLLFVMALLSAFAARWTVTRFREKSKQWLGVRIFHTAIVLTLTLGTGEMAARALLDWDQVVCGDDYWRCLWARRRMSGQNPYPTDQHDPLLGWKPVPGYRSAEMNTNSRGARGLREYAVRRSPGVRRIVAVGDSMTFGEPVADGEAFTALLERMLSNSEVINLGVHGYGIDQIYLRLRQSGFDYRPDLVLVGVYGGDLYRATLSFRDYAKPRFIIDDDRLALTNTPIPPPDQYSDGSPECHLPRSYLLGAVKRMVWRYIDQTYFAPKWNLAEKILDATAEVCDAHDARMILVYIPTVASDAVRYPGKVMGKWAESRGVAYVNLGGTFATMSEEDRSKLYDGHLTPYGHRVAAEAIASAIEKLPLPADIGVVPQAP